MNKDIFRAYDIRGIFGSDLNEENAYLIGKAFGSKIKKLGQKKQWLDLIIGVRLLFYLKV